MDFNTVQAITAMQQRCAQILDSNDLSGWPDLFTAQGCYQLQSRENFDAGLPLSVMHLTSQGMLRDRVVAVSGTIYHQPYYQCHVCSAPMLTTISGSAVRSESSYLVVRTQRDCMPHILSVGRYIDDIVLQDGAWLFAQRLVVFDNDLIANSIIKPV
jgi:salicylate 5-hydroxylase small subunit